MSIAPLLLGAAALFWGLQSGHWIAGLVFALAIESPRLVPQRWALESRDFSRITDLSTLSLVAIAAYLVNEGRALFALTRLLGWLPAFFLPLMLAQGFSLRQKIPLASLFLSLRRLQRRGVGRTYGDVDLRAPYLGLLLVSAGSGATSPLLYLPGVLALLGWLLWLNRSPRFHALLWVGLIAVSGGLGIAGNLGVQAARHELERLVLAWYKDYWARFRDPYHSYTAIGDIGQLKLSDAILFRVKSQDPVKGSLLLADAAYNIYSRGVWFAEDTDFSPVTPSPTDVMRWPLTAQRPEAHGPWIQVSGELSRKGEGLLIHPLGTYLVDRMPVLELWRNGLGALKAKDGPPLVTYRIYSDAAIQVQSPPSADDTNVPREEVPLLRRILASLDLEGLPPAQGMQRIERYFRQGFRYSLTLSAPPPGVRPLEHFLLQTRAGHCEYFATATVLLLRLVGIPARYATGYSVREYSRLEGAYLVRRRHAHAWALAFVDGRWQNIDTTPSVWAEREAEHTSLLRPVEDFASWIRHAFMEWRWRPQEADESGVPGYAWLLIPLTAWLGWRLLRGKRARPRRTTPPQAGGPPLPGADSAFFRIVRHVEQGGWVRNPGEPLGGWISRISTSRHFPWDPRELFELLRLHNRHRYLPGGLGAQERGELKKRAAQWLERQDLYAKKAQ